MTFTSGLVSDTNKKSFEYGRKVGIKIVCLGFFFLIANERRPTRCTSNHLCHYYGDLSNCIRNKELAHIWYHRNIHIERTVSCGCVSRSERATDAKNSDTHACMPIQNVAQRMPFNIGCKSLCVRVCMFGM